MVHNPAVLGWPFRIECEGYFSSRVIPRNAPKYPPGSRSRADLDLAAYLSARSSRRAIGPSLAI